MLYDTGTSSASSGTASTVASTTISSKVGAVPSHTSTVSSEPTMHGGHGKKPAVVFPSDPVASSRHVNGLWTGCTLNGPTGSPSGSCARKSSTNHCCA